MKVSIHWDSIASRAVIKRAGDCCVSCGAFGTQGAHIFSRGQIGGRRNPVRYKAMIALCPSCHSYMDQHPKELEAFCIGYLGEDEYYALRRQVRQVCKYGEDQAREYIALCREELESG